MYVAVHRWVTPEPAARAKMQTVLDYAEPGDLLLVARPTVRDLVLRETYTDVAVFTRSPATNKLCVVEPADDAGPRITDFREYMWRHGARPEFRAVWRQLQPLERAAVHAAAAWRATAAAAYVARMCENSHEASIALLVEAAGRGAAPFPFCCPAAHTGGRRFRAHVAAEVLCEMGVCFADPAHAGLHMAPRHFAVHDQALNLTRDNAYGPEELIV